MKIIQKLGNNAAIGTDNSGKEIVVLGKGVGFPKIPYELTDLSKVERTFYDVDLQYINVLPNLSHEALMSSADIVEQAEINIDSEFNPNLVFTLADHIQFAVERVQSGIHLDMSLSYEVRHLYKDEYELGILGLDIIEDYFGLRLPEQEAGNIAFHLLDAEMADNKNVCGAMEDLQIIDDIDTILEKELGIQLDRETFQYSRFVMHLHYLFQRLRDGKKFDDNVLSLYRAVAQENVDVYNCVQIIAKYLGDKKGWECTKDELLYLMIHINRIRTKNE